MSIDVLVSGMQTTVQDAGRRGHAALGVGRAGAMDDAALRLANILVGNVENAAALEIVLRGPRLRLGDESLVAITGAGINVRCGGELLPTWRPIALRAGSELEFGGMPFGTCSYLAVAGGIDTTPVLGSRSIDVNSRLGGAGGRALAAGDSLPARSGARALCQALWKELDTSSCAFATTNWSLDPQPWFDADTQRPVRVVSGTHFPHLDNSSQRALFASEFRVGIDSNRVGYRLEGTLLALREQLEPVSEGVIPGTVQLPPAGQPIVLMAEAPTCGGYPRIAHVISVDLPRLAQRRPGAALRFAETSLDDAQTRYLRRERALVRIGRTIAERLDA